MTDLVNSTSAGDGHEPSIVESPDGHRSLAPTRARAFLGLVRAGDMLARELDAQLQREHSLSLREFEVLLFLAVFAAGEPMRVSELARSAPLSQSRVSRLIADLERRGLVARSTVEGDARGVAVTISPLGGDAFAAAQRSHLEGLEEKLFSRLSEDEIGALARITAKILESDDGR